MTELETRPWVQTARAVALKEEEHVETWRRNWASGTCEGCLSAGNCPTHHGKVPCDSCGCPVKQSTVYEFSLCAGCVEEKPADFIEWVKARGRCRGEIETLKAQVAFAREKLHRVRMALGLA